MKWLLVVLVILLAWLFYKIAKFDSQYNVEEIMKRLKEEKEEFKEEMEEVGEVIEDTVEEFVEDVKELFEEEQHCRCKDCMGGVFSDCRKLPEINVSNWNVSKVTHCDEEHECCKGCNECNCNDEEK